MLSRFNFRALQSDSVERWLLWIFIVTIPIQRRLILFQTDWNFNEWRSGFFYGTDMLVLALLGFWAWRLTTHREKLEPGARYLLFAGIMFVITAGISAVHALVPRVSWYQTIKLLECIILATYCTSAIRRFGLPWLLTAFVVGGVVQAGIAVGQLIHQADIGLRILGESVLRPSMTGIASFYTFAGEKLIRAYGTTPHPNVLAMYLALSLSAWWGLYIVRIKTMRLFHRWIFIVAYAVMFWGFFATFSRTVIVLWVCMMMVLVVVSVVSQKIRRHVWTEVMKRWIYGAMLFSVALAALFAWVYWDAVFARMAITGNEEAVTLRLYYNEQALNTGSGMHWTGIGIGNFASWLMVHAPFAPRYLYQPAHNLYLLVYAEMGILGMGACAGVLGVVFFMLFRQWQKEKMRVWYISAVLGLVLMVALFDHFFWTLQQGRLMLWVVVGVIVGQSTRHDS